RIQFIIDSILNNNIYDDVHNWINTWWLWLRRRSDIGRTIGAYLGVKALIICMGSVPDKIITKAQSDYRFLEKEGLLKMLFGFCESFGLTGINIKDCINIMKSHQADDGSVVYSDEAHEVYASVFILELLYVGENYYNSYYVVRAINWHKSRLTSWDKYMPSALYAFMKATQKYDDPWLVRGINSLLSPEAQNYNEEYYVLQYYAWTVLALSEFLKNFPQGLSGQARLSVEKLISSDVVTLGENVHVIVKIKNVSSETARSIKLTDSYPQGFELVGGQISSLIGDLSPNKEKIIEYTLRAVKTGVYSLPPAKVEYEDELGIVKQAESNTIYVRVQELRTVTTAPTSRTTETVTSPTKVTTGVTTNTVPTIRTTTVEKTTTIATKIDENLIAIISSIAILGAIGAGWVRTRRRMNKKHYPTDQQVVDASAKYGGILTATTLVHETGCSLEQAEKALERFVKRGVATKRLSKDMIVVYDIPSARAHLTNTDRILIEKTLQEGGRIKRVRLYQLSRLPNEAFEEGTDSLIRARILVYDSLNDEYYLTGIGS
ncbi:MAG: BatD family protein, partial [Candidatus Caldarchaeum sp.]